MFNHTFAAFASSAGAAKPAAQQPNTSTARLAKDFRTGEARTALGNLTNKAAASSSSSGKTGNAVKKSKISSTQSLTSKVNPAPKPGQDDAPRRKSSLGRRKEPRLSVSAMEIESAGVNQSVDMGDLDSSHAVFVDEEEEVEREAEVEKGIKEEEVVEATIVVPVQKEKIPLPMGCLNIDEVDENDPQWVTDYVHSIFDYLRENEVRALHLSLRPWSTRFARNGQFDDGTFVDLLALFYVCRFA